MLSAYPACFIKEEGGYSVIFPDLNHLATCGRTLDEAQNMAVDCLAGYLFWLQEDGEPIPPPSPADKIHLAEIVGETESSDAVSLYTSPSPRDRQKVRMPSSA